MGWVAFLLGAILLGLAGAGGGGRFVVVMNRPEEQATYNMVAEFVVESSVRMSPAHGGTLELRDGRLTC